MIFTVGTVTYSLTMTVVCLANRAFVHISIANVSSCYDIYLKFQNNNIKI